MVAPSSRREFDEFNRIDFRVRKLISEHSSNLGGRSLLGNSELELELKNYFKRYNQNFKNFWSKQVEVNRNDFRVRKLISYNTLQSWGVWCAAPEVR